MNTTRSDAKRAARSAARAAREQAKQGVAVAEHARQWAAPHLEAAVDRVTPAVDAARDRVSPAVDAARERVSPAVDSARDRLVDDLLPRLVEAIGVATAAGWAARDAAAQKVSSTVEDAALAVAEATPTARERRRRSRRSQVQLLVVAVLAALAAAGVAWRRGRSSATGWESLPTAVPSPLPTPASSAPSNGHVIADEPAVVEPDAAVSPEPEPELEPDVKPGRGGSARRS